LPIAAGEGSGVVDLIAGFEEQDLGLRNERKPELLRQRAGAPALEGRGGCLELAATRTHDMALTEHYVVLVTLPSPEPDSGTRIVLVPRDGGPARWCDDDACWIGHIAAAYELDDPAAGNPVVVDHVQAEHPVGVIADRPIGRGRLERIVIDPAAGTLRRTTPGGHPGGR
jgi:hypothetical protein